MRPIEEEARAILLRARGQAEQLLTAAQVEAEELRKLSVEQGHAEGLAAGTAKGIEQGKAAGTQQALAESKATLASVTQALASAMAALDTQRTRLEIEGTTDVVRLAVAIARRVVGRMVEVEPSVVGEVAAAAMKLVTSSTDVRLAVNPIDKSAMDDALPRIQNAMPMLKHAEVIADESVARGGCRINTRGGVIDADLNGQIDRIAETLIPSRRP